MRAEVNVRERRMVGAFLFLFGLFALPFGVSVLVLGVSPATTGLSCQAVCGLAMLATDFFGPLAGRILSSGFYVFAGFAFLFVGRAVYNGR